jgi:H+/Cl- antiporter ClcA
MQTKQKKSFGKKIKLQLQVWFRRYPAIPYVLKWTLICLFIGVGIGSASAGFLQSLDWATSYRESHLWLIALLPIGGFSIGLLYYYLGKDIEAGNNLLIDTIHDPK